MRGITPLLLLFSFVASGCSTLGGQSSEGNRSGEHDASAHYRQLSSEAAPATWSTGASWTFIALDERDAIAQSFVLRITDVPQDACMAGDWKKLEVVGGEAANLHGPAYLVEGRNLLILLSTQLCDAYPMYRGTLSGNGFTGVHVFEHMMGSREYGKVFGVPVEALRGATPAPGR